MVYLRVALYEGDQLVHLPHLSLDISNKGLCENWASVHMLFLKCFTLYTSSVTSLVYILPEEDFPLKRGKKMQKSKSLPLLPNHSALSWIMQGKAASFPIPGGAICTFCSSTSSSWGIRATKRGGLFCRAVYLHSIIISLSRHFISKALNSVVLPAK